MNRRRKPLIEKNYRLMRSAYLQAGRDFVSRLRKYGMQVLTDGDIKTANADPVVDAYKKIFSDTALEFAKYGRSSFPKTKKADPVDLNNSRWVRDIQDATDELILESNFSKSLYNTCIDEITRVARSMVDDGIARGLSIDSMASELADGFMSQFGDSAKWMARRVAQTETIRASNFGTKEGVTSRGVEYVQSWLCAYSGVRDTHLQAAIDNDRIPADQLFRVYDVDGNPHDCEYPGDPSLPPDQSINCRCSWTAEPSDYQELMG